MVIGVQQADQAAGRREVIHFPAGAGPSVWFNDAIYTFKATKDSTNGALTFAEASVPPGGGPPPHIHEACDEAFWIISGQVEFLNGERTFQTTDGDFVWVPRGIRHRFRNVGVHVARLIFLFTPGGMDGFFTSIGTQARAGEPPLPPTPEQQRQIVDLAPYYGLQLRP